MSVHQKLGIILESKSVQKLNLEKMFLPKTLLSNLKWLFAKFLKALKGKARL